MGVRAANRKRRAKRRVCEKKKNSNNTHTSAWTSSRARRPSRTRIIQQYRAWTPWNGQRGEGWTRLTRENNILSPLIIIIVHCATIMGISHLERINIRRQYERGGSGRRDGEAKFVAEEYNIIVIVILYSPTFRLCSSHTRIVLPVRTAFEFRRRSTERIEFHPVSCR